MAYYWLKSAAAAPLKLEILDTRGSVRACAASDTPVKPVDTEAINVQAIWQQPTQPPAATAGMHRFALAPAVVGGFGGGRRGPAAPAAKDACTPPAGSAPPPTRAARPAGSGGGGGRGASNALQPGDYTIRMTVDGQTYTQPVTVKPDPRGVPANTANEDVNNRE